MVDIDATDIFRVKAEQADFYEFRFPLRLGPEVELKRLSSWWILVLNRLPMCATVT